MGVLTPEAKVKQFIKKTMESWFPDAWQYCPVGGPFGKAGAPDFIYFWNGVFIAIEAKADGGVLSALQRQTLEVIKNQGGVAAVVYGKDTEKMQSIREAILRAAQ